MRTCGRGLYKYLCGPCVRVGACIHACIHLLRHGSTNTQTQILLLFLLSFSFLSFSHLPPLRLLVLPKLFPFSRLLISPLAFFPLSSPSSSSSFTSCSTSFTSCSTSSSFSSYFFLLTLRPPPLSPLSPLISSSSPSISPCSPYFFLLQFACVTPSSFSSISFSPFLFPSPLYFHPSAFPFPPFLFFPLPSPAVACLEGLCGGRESARAGGGRAQGGRGEGAGRVLKATRERERQRGGSLVNQPGGEAEAAAET